jgi:cold shock protein
VFDNEIDAYLARLTAAQPQSTRRKTAMTTSATMTGFVVWYDPKKDFGFLKPDNGGPDVFLHGSAMRQSGIRNLQAGEAVSFRTEPGRSGRLQARDLRLAA